MQGKLCIRLQSIPRLRDWKKLRNRPKETIEKYAKTDLLHDEYLQSNSAQIVIGNSILMY